jgi:hypothetical protein
VDGHRTAERRSLAYHQAIVARLQSDPSLVERARARVESWRGTETHPKWIDAWAALLDRPLVELCRALVEPDEQMTALRQVTPFAGVLDPRTRWSLWSQVR